MCQSIKVRNEKYSLNKSNDLCIFLKLILIVADVPYPVRVPVEQPHPIQIEQHTPVRVNKPLPYLHHVHIPIVNGDNHHSTDVHSGREELSGGYS